MEVEDEPEPHGLKEPQVAMDIIEGKEQYRTICPIQVGRLYQYQLALSSLCGHFVGWEFTDINLTDKLQASRVLILLGYNPQQENCEMGSRCMGLATEVARPPGLESSQR